MSKQYFICSVITFTAPDDSTGYGAKIREFILDNSVVANYVAEIPIDDVTNEPKFTWCLICADSSDFSTFPDDANTISLPIKTDINEEFNLESTIRTDIENKGVSIPADPINLRVLIEVIGKTLSPKFDVGNFKV